MPLNTFDNGVGAFSTIPMMVEFTKREIDLRVAGGNRIQRAVDLIDVYDMHGSVDHSIALELKKILDPTRALSTKAKP